MFLISMVEFIKRRVVQVSRSGWSRIIEAIDKPLGFYVLALLIVEGFLALVLTVADLEPTVRGHGMWAGVALFILVVGVVTLCVWHKPTHLTFTELGSLVEMGKASYGTEHKEIIPEELPSGVAKQ